MKKTLTLFATVVLSIASWGQTSSGVWNSNEALYMNDRYGIKWQLISDWSWVERPILGKTTLLKVRNDETQILVKLGVDPTNADDKDIWEHIDNYNSPKYLAPLKEMAQNYGMTFLGLKAVRSQLCGIHANKIRYDMVKYYPEQNSRVHSTEYIYQLNKDGYIFTISVMALSVLEEELDDFDRLAAILFNGFAISI